MFMFCQVHFVETGFISLCLCQWPPRYADHHGKRRFLDKEQTLPQISVFCSDIFEKHAWRVCLAFFSVTWWNVLWRQRRRRPDVDCQVSSPAMAQGATAAPRGESDGRDRFPRKRDEMVFSSHLDPSKIKILAEVHFCCWQTAVLWWHVFIYVASLFCRMFREMKGRKKSFFLTQPYMR